LHLGFTAQSITNGVRSTLKLIIALPEQHYNYPSHTRQLCLHIGPMPIEALPFGATSPGCHSGVPLVPMVLRASLWRGVRHSPHQTESMPSLTLLVAGTPIRELSSSMVRHCVYLRTRPPQCIFNYGIVPKVSVLGGPLATLDLSSKDLTYIGSTYFGTHLGCPSFGASPVKRH
jgi:hypothetical protein